MDQPSPPIAASAKKELTDLGSSLAARDFSGLYNVYTAALQERAQAVSMYVKLLFTPFITAVAATLVKQLMGVGDTGVGGSYAQEQLLQMLQAAPWEIKSLFLVAGLAGIVPFQRFIDGHCQAYKMSRAMNNYRLLYRLVLASPLADIGWSTGLKVDPNFPSPLRYDHWVFIFCVLMLVIDTSLVCLGFYLLFGNIIGAVLVAVFSMAVHAYLYGYEVREIGWKGRREDEEHKAYLKKARTFRELAKECAEYRLWKPAQHISEEDAKRLNL